MGGYLVNFAIYTMAMLGLIFFALMVYQKTTQNGGLGLKKSNFLKVEESVSFGPRKTLYVVRAGHERFLLASDMDKTTFISKLDSNENISSEVYQTSTPLDKIYPEPVELERQEQKTFRQKQKPQIQNNSIDELPVIVDFNQRKRGAKNQVLQNMLNKINE